MTRRKTSADHCVACGECSPKCPQGLDIPDRLQVAHEALKGWIE